jgi:hypothetical protein
MTILVVVAAQLGLAQGHPVLAASQATPELYLGLMYPGTPATSALRTTESQIGKGAALVLWYQSWEAGGQPQAFPADQLTAIRQHGSIPVLAWEPGAYPPPASDPRYSLAAIASGRWDTFLRQYAVAAKAWGHPFFLRFASEMNGSWTQWSEQSNGNQPGQFVQAWRHVHDIFKAVGATNVTWVWCPNTEGVSTTPLQELYPGDAYVDWAGMDGYNYGSDYSGGPWRSFSQIFTATYQDLAHIIPPTVPIMIGETGSVEHGGSKPAWIHDALTVQLPARFPRIKALIWFDTSDGKYNLSVDTSAQSLAAFRSAITLKTYQSNQYADLDQSPIPAPEQIIHPQHVPLTYVTTPLIQNALGGPLIQNVLGGPPPGSIQLVDAERDTPVAAATLTFADGWTEQTGADGAMRFPMRDSATVLQRVNVGATVIYAELAVDPVQGYQIQIDLATGSITHILVNIIQLALPAALQGGLLAVLTLLVGARLARRRPLRPLAAHAAHAALLR